MALYFSLQIACILLGAFLAGLIKQGAWLENGGTAKRHERSQTARTKPSRKT